mmetsp:Transcript_17868/g.25188  ORF Transcript_17868/g.25188 Transcript_17868/m.25188 type:complete len:110 (+) Transcript_17868:26-355(+)
MLFYCYYSISYLIGVTLLSGVQKDLVRFVQALAVTKASWYYIQHVADDIPSLSQLLHTSEQETMCTLHLTGTATQSEEGDYQFKASAFKNFVVTNNLFQISNWHHPMLH